MIPTEFIDEVLARTDIVEIIEPRVSLKRSGQNHTGLCPFHNEKTPSFSVSQDKQFYYCFGCQASGTALKFLMEFDRMDFVSAVEYLAGRAGLAMPQTGPGDGGRESKRRKGLYEILEQSSAYFREQLRTHPEKDRAVSYLKGRGLSGKIARDFGLGYAPPGWESLLRKLGTSNHDRQLLIDAGMVVDAESDGKVYDRFRDRIMFPIRDLRGRTVAFGGRVLSDEAKPKYLNSPETPVFHKGRELYGLCEARKRTGKLERLLVVEGYMDVVALSQHGIGYSVATLGTATSADHIERMFRLVPLVVFCFDGDEAGRNAAWKALRATLTAIQDGKAAKFLFLPEGDDPDSLVRKEGQAAFEARIDAATGLTEFFFARLEDGVDLSSPEGKAALTREAAPLIREIPQGVFRELMIKELSGRAGLPEERLIKAAGLDMARPPEPARARPRPASPRRTADVTRLLDRATAMLLQQPEVALRLGEGQREALRQVPEWQLLAEMVEWSRENAVISPLVLLSHYQDSGHFDYLRDLAEADLLLSPSAMADEFQGMVRKLLDEADSKLKQAVIDELLAKPLSELSEEERQMLVSHSKSRARN